MAAGADSDFVHVRDSDYYGAGGPKPRDRLCVLVCYARDELSALAVLFSRNLELNLDRNRNAVQEAECLSFFPALSAGFCFLSCTGTC